MKQFLRIVYYLVTHSIRTFSFSFWTILYPILLSSVLIFALSNLKQTFEPIPLAVAEDTPVQQVLASTQLFKLTTVSSDEEGAQLVSDKTVVGYVDHQLALTALPNASTNLTIVRNTLDQIVQARELGADARFLDFSHQYTQLRDQESNGLKSILYSILASVCFYAIFTAIHICELLQPNLSTLGARCMTTPIPKYYYVFTVGIITFGMNLLSNLLYLAYLHYVFHITLFTNFGESLIILVCANMTSTAIGMAIGYSSKLGAELKISISQAINLLLSATTGLMGPEPMAFINRWAPALNQFNPISVVATNFYRINGLNNFSTIGQGVLILLVYALIGVAIASISVRRVQYDSL